MEPPACAHQHVRGVQHLSARGCGDEFKNIFLFIIFPGWFQREFITTGSIFIFSGVLKQIEETWFVDMNPHLNDVHHFGPFGSLA